MKKTLVLFIGCSFLFSACLIVGPRRGKRRKGVHNHRCHPSEYWNGHKCKHKGKAKGHKKHKKHKKRKKHDHH